MIKVFSQRNVGLTFRTSVRPFLLSAAVLATLILSNVSTHTSSAAFGEALYFSLSPNTPLPQSPSSLLVQSPSFINVPAGALLTVHLLQGDSLISTSTLSFQQAYSSQLQVPAVPVASFLPSGNPIQGQPLPNATLTAGIADLTKVVAAPAAYKLLWMLSAGTMGTPGVATTFGEQGGFATIDLKLRGVSAALLAGDQKPGSVLFFNRYTSNASNPGRENTTINLTNTNPASTAYVRLFLVTASTCQTTELQICLAPQQTTSLLMSDLDPGVKGYAIAVATNLQGEPVQFNWLTGNVILRQPAGNISGSYNSVLSAVAIAKRKEGNVANVNGVADMIFDDVNFDRLPGQIAFDSVPSQVSATNATLISLYRPPTDLSGNVAGTSVQITGFGQNNQGQVISSTGSLSSACYSDVALGSFRLQPTTINQLLPVGATAWFAASATDLQPLMGAQFNSGEFNSGGNARPLSFSAEYKIRIPIAPVTCPQP
ncbi:MAG TPA: hypothetical protein PLD20_21325 [Blastocatellia bacterium]|nr:hypothetical protein [Blastocatellia bacterium]HMV85682.1 hypothetical protein [Blastocatellia bacterium]HMX25541.1 hypothetical protein [Blastocatellia bacterium]HMY76099.1 hypothetical protein [Blastocatellia bacterium]HMZ20493.1 hypothetical protein [Blastocatellia bacterium]